MKQQQTCAVDTDPELSSLLTSGLLIARPYLCETEFILTGYGLTSDKVLLQSITCPDNRVPRVSGHVMTFGKLVFYFS